MSKLKNKAKQIEMISAAAGILGWLIAIPSTENPDDEITGIIMGTKEYVDKTVAESSEDYLIFEPEIVH